MARMRSARSYCVRALALLSSSTFRKIFIKTYLTLPLVRFAKLPHGQTMLRRTSGSTATSNQKYNVILSFCLAMPKSTMVVQVRSHSGSDSKCQKGKYHCAQVSEAFRCVLRAKLKSKLMSPVLSPRESAFCIRLLDSAKCKRGNFNALEINLNIHVEINCRLVGIMLLQEIVCENMHTKKMMKKSRS